MAAKLLDEICPADDDPRLRATEQLVARETDEIRPSCEACTRSRLVADLDERAGAEIIHEWQIVTARDARQFAQRRLLGKAHDAEVRLMDA